MSTDSQAAMDAPIPPMSKPRLVVVGASAGGLEAVERFFRAADTALSDRRQDWVFVIIQHLSQDHRSIMDDLLRRYCQFAVHYAEEGLALAGGSCYLIPAHADITMAGDRFHLGARPPAPQPHHPIDLWCESLSAEQAAQTTLVICSGSGNDGARGAQYLATHGGQVWIQHPDEARFRGMPEAAWQAVDGAHVAMVGDIPGYLARQAFDDGQGLPATGGERAYPQPNPPPPRRLLFQKLADEYRLHLEHYKAETIDRRLQHRRQLSNCPDEERYIAYALSDAAEREALVRELLVDVTAFFRDPEQFELLAQHLRQQLQDHPSDREYRVWVAGCATGEEAYSVAMLLYDIAAELPQAPALRIWATDLHPDSIRRAGQGVYSRLALEAIGPERLERHVLLEYQKGSIRPHIRDLIVFAPHDLLSDPPFLHLDVLCCRNLLIYFKADIQQALMRRFALALSTNGILLLGASEKMTDQNSVHAALTALSPRVPLYVKQHPIAYDPLQDLALPIGSSGQGGRRMARWGAAAPGKDLGSPSAHSESISSEPEDEGLAALIRHCVPDGFLVDGHGELLHVFGAAGRWLVLEGPASRRLERWLPEHVAQAVSTLLAACSLGSTTSATVQVPAGDGAEAEMSAIQVRVRRLPAPGERKHFYVALEPIAAALAVELDRPATGDDQSSILDQHIKRLETELQQARAALLGTRQDLETHSEELQATVEEFNAANEELQSSNEELQSLNEELHSVNAELSEKNEQLHSMATDLEQLLSANDTPKIFVSADGHIRRFTHAAPRVFFIRQQDIGRHLGDLNGPLGSGASLWTMMEALRRQVADNGPLSHEEEVHDPSGITYLLRIHANIDAQCAVIGFALSWINITWIKAEQLRLEEQQRHLEATIGEQTATLREQRDLLQNLSDYVPNMLWMTNDQEELIYVNKAVIDYHGEVNYPDFRTGWRDVVHPADVDRFEQLVFSALSARQAYTGQWRLRSATGSYRWFQAHGAPRFDDQGAFLGFVGTLVDIDREQRIQEELKQTAERLNLTVEAAGIGLWDWDCAQDELYWNHRMYALHGMAAPSDEQTMLTVEDARSAVHPDDLAHWEKTVSEAMQITTDDHYRVIFRPSAPQSSSDSALWILGIGRVYRDDQGAPRRLAGICLDITSQRQLEYELATAVKAAESANAEKSRFLATMSHELRTPMNAILGLGQHLQQSVADPEHRRLIVKMLAAGQGLLRLINDILDFSRLQAGRLTLRPEAVHLPSLVEQMQSLYEPQRFVEKAVDLQWHVDPQLPEWIEIDHLRLQQIMTNLLANALKFTIDGQVAMHLSVADSRGQSDAQGLPAHWSLAVRDTGIGISEEHLSRLGEEFFQVDQPPEMVTSGGSGLGLSIVNSLVQLMGGQWHIQSQVGEGTTVTVTLPLVPHAGPAQSLMEAPSAVAGQALPNCSGKRLLIADDNELNREVAVHLLESTGAHLDMAVDGCEVLHKLQAQSYDLILMDVQMPLLDGIEACRALRAKQHVLPVVAVSAADDEQTQKTCREVGMQGYLRKPLVKEPLYRLLRELLKVPDQAITELADVLPTQAQDLARYLLASEFDVALGVRLSEGNVEFYRRMLERFAVQLSEHFAPLATLQPDQAGPEMRRLVHTLKGSAGAVAACRLMQLGQQLLTQHEQGQAWSPLVCAELRQAIALAQSQLSQWQDHQLAARAPAVLAPSAEDGESALAQLRRCLTDSTWVDEGLLHTACAHLQTFADDHAVAQLRQLIQQVRHAQALKLLNHIVSGVI